MKHSLSVLILILALFASMLVILGILVAGIVFSRDEAWENITDISQVTDEVLSDNTQSYKSINFGSRVSGFKSVDYYSCNWESLEGENQIIRVKSDEDTSAEVYLQTDDNSSNNFILAVVNPDNTVTRLEEGNQNIPIQEGTNRIILACVGESNGFTLEILDDGGARFIED